MQNLLEVRDLRKIFQLHLLDGRIIEPVDGISFNLLSGHVMLVSGKSGAGKTTIIKCIYRTYLASAGEIWFNSQEFGPLELNGAAERMVLRLREREIGYCSQFLKVLPRVPALDVVAEPLVRRGESLEEARKIAATWLARLRLEESRWQAYPVTFSGGEQQRVNLARAFIAAPRLLLLDEPTASLDARSKEIVLEIIREAKKAGVGIVVVSHDTEHISTLADETFWLDKN
jgi:alpha-D-ribose 1-methylphosphonate 5-triphosphate synthase subunit PhnL